MFDKKEWQHNNYVERRTYILSKQKNYYNENKERYLERSRLYYAKNKEQIDKKNIERDRIRRKLNRELFNYKQRVRNFRLRLKLMEVLGSYICVRCNEGDYRCLQFDHIHGGGNKDMNRFGGTQMYSTMVRYYIKNPDEAKRNLQVLCSNCNIKKGNKRGLVTMGGPIFGKIAYYSDKNNRKEIIT